MNTTPEAAPPVSRGLHTVGFLFSKFTLRHWKQHPLRALGLVTLLAIGVAVFLSIRLANRAAVASFVNFAEAVTQQTDAILSARGGSLPESLLRELRVALEGTGVEIIPLVETVGAAPSGAEQGSLGTRPSYTLLGVDLVAIQNYASAKKAGRTWFGQNKSAQNGDANGFWETLQAPRAVFCTETLGAELHRAIGDPLAVSLNDQRITWTIAGWIPVRADQPAPPQGLLVADLPTVQELSHKEGRLDRIEFLFPESPRSPQETERLLNLIQSTAGSLGKVRTPESRKLAAETMTRGFRLNLTILSLLALAVGLYLVFQALDAAVIRRRAEIAVLRALGVTPREIRVAWTLEALALGVVGGIAGVFLGWGLAQGAVGMVSQTVNALYYATHARAAALLPDEALAAVVVSVVASLLAGWLPAREAACTPPAQLMNLSVDSPLAGPASLRARTGWWIVAAACALAFLPAVPLASGGHFPLAGYGSAFLGIVGAGFLAGGGLRGLGRLLESCAGHFAPRKLAASHLRFPTSRHRWAVAGLLCAVAMTGGMAILVGSFERSVRAWIEHTLHSDLYLTSEANQTASSYNRIPEQTWRKILSRPEVAEGDIALLIPLEMPGGSIRLMGASLEFSGRRDQFTWKEAPRSGEVFDPQKNQSLCLMSESFANRFKKKPGDLVQIPTPQGEQTLQIAGTYTDFGDEQGVLFVERAHAARWFGTEEASTLALVLRPGVDGAKVQAELRRDHPGVAVFSNAHLRAEVLRIFQQTFAITFALEGIGVAVAVAGLGVTLASMLAERTGELTTLRALGMTHREIAQTTAWEGALLAVCGTGAGLLTSLALGALLIHIINRQTFGWTLQTSHPWGALLGLCLLVILSGAGVAWSVGRRGASLPVDQQG